MPLAGTCRVCSHERAADINAELLSPNKGRRSLRGIAGLFAVSHETMRRHYRNCLSQAESQVLADTPQDTAQTETRTIGFSQELATRAIELNERAQMCGSSTQMVIITRELAKLLADVAQNAINR